MPFDALEAPITAEMSHTSPLASTSLISHPSEPQTPPDTLACSCTAYAHYLDPRMPYINAEDMPLNSIAAVGNLAVFYYPKSGLYHVAYIMALDDDQLSIKESNFKRCTYTERILSENDESIIGFFAP